MKEKKSVLRKGERIELPDFDSIKFLCQEIIIQKSDIYGNSWVGHDYKINKVFWDKRLLGEVKEFIENNNPANAKKELLDIINVCMMIFENIPDDGVK